MHPPLKRLIVIGLLSCLISSGLYSQEKNWLFSIDVVTTPVMVFIPIRSNLPNYLISVGGKSELLGINFEWLKAAHTYNPSVTSGSFLTLGASVRALGLNWRKKPFNHAVNNDINAKDIVYMNLFVGGKFIIRGFERGALNLALGPGLLLGPALQNDNVKDGVFTTLGLDVSVTFSYDLTNHNSN